MNINRYGDFIFYTKITDIAGIMHNRQAEYSIHIVHRAVRNTVQHSTQEHYTCARV